MPVHLYHAGLDEIAPIQSAEIPPDAWCDAGVSVQWREYPLAEHLGGIAAGYATATDFLDGRFDGETATSVCS